MSDNHRRYSSIREALCKLLGNPQGRAMKQLNVLAAMISGIVGSKHTHYPKIACKVPDHTKPESRIKRFSRFINDVDEEQMVHFTPFAQALLTALAENSLVLVMDGSEVGRKCLALMMSVIYRGRALPIAWIVVKGSKGHFPETMHIKLLEKVHEMVPTSADVIFLGDGEFDGMSLQATLDGYSWEYVCRTASNTILSQNDEEFSYQSLSLHPGERLSLPDMFFTRQHYGPVLAIGWWRTGCQEPIYLVTNMDLPEEACHWYQKRFHIETFFSDQKGRGFHIDKSHLSAPARIARLLVAACLAYIWVVYLGVTAKTQGLDKIIHRTDRCDWSLFQMGLHLLEYLLNHDMAIPVAFTVPV